MSSYKEIFRDLLGTMPERCDLDPMVESTVDLGPIGRQGIHIIRQRVTYSGEPGERIPAYLLIPQTGRDEQLPTFLWHHQHEGKFYWGKSEVVGDVGNPDQAVGLELAKLGYIVLAPDAYGFEERGPYAGNLGVPDDLHRGANAAGHHFERFEAMKALLHGSTMQAKMFSDVQRGVDYLLSLAMVDPNRIGMGGHSLGGQETLVSTALDPRIVLGLASCGFSSFRAIELIRRNHNFALYVPRILEGGRDLGDLLAEVAPRYFMAINGRNDLSFPVSGVRDTFKIARAEYTRQKVADRLVLLTHPGEHEFPRKARLEAYRFADRHLRYGMAA